MTDAKHPAPSGGGLSQESNESTMLEIHRSQADTDYTIAYIDGRPAAIEENDGGFYGFVKDGEYVENYYQQQWWYVENGRWHSRFADHTALIDLMEGYTLREINDGSQEVYDGDLEVAFAD